MTSGRYCRCGTIKTALLQGPSRTRTFAGQALAVIVALAASSVLTLTLAGVASTLIAAVETGSISPANSPFPDGAVLARAVGAGLLVSVTYGAVGLTLGTLFRSAGGAIAVALLWTVVLQPTLTNLAQLPGLARTINDILPNGTALALTHIFGSVSFGSDVVPVEVHVNLTAATWMLAAYAIAFLGAPALMIRRRDIT